ncbi:hypothetical protein [Bacillus licheniformis]|uniref:hypothetical protein n=1 Tax=Bacillus licheniformis TaxID=1402 RepID=UPI00038E4528|nr:hypothetical protein [Bacillus licheniformis]EQM25369.1 hypothetical protein N399_24260 [Bacillus licheniformis CG-B52]TWM21458.1 hypothetical protein CHCC15087_3683 [Bacillus licheniformis]
MTKTNEKIHVLVDESLGGIKREYVEVNRKAKLGEKIVIVDADPGYGDHYSNEDVFTVELYTGYGSGVATECGHLVGNNEYRTLEPTNVVHIDGERYEMVDRKAEVCEKVIHMNNGKSGGRVGEVTNVGVGVIDVIEYEHPDGDITCGFSHGCYRVLVPLSKENKYQEFKDKKRGYKEVKNFIHNELGITKDDIQEIIRIAVSNEVKKAAESGEFQSFISSKIDSLIEEGFGDGGRLLYGFKERVSQTVSNEVGKRIANNLNISVELKSQ